MNGTVTIDWANGEDQFCLTQVKHVLDLEDKCGAGVREVMRRLEEDRWRYNDVRETIRLGLIGGGTPPDKAMVVVRRHVDGQAMAPNVLVAYAVLQAALIGVPGDEVGKSEAERTRKGSASTGQTAGSSAPRSTASGPH